MVSPVVAKITARRGARTTMTVTKLRTDVSAVKQLLAADKEFLKPLIRGALQEVLEAEMTEALGAEKGERSEGRLGYRSYNLVGEPAQSLIVALPPGLARSSSRCRRTARDGSRLSCSNAISARRRRWLRHWRRCTCKGSRRGRSSRSPRNWWGTRSRPRQSAPSTSGWMRR